MSIQSDPIRILYNLEAEEAVLGSIVINPDVYDEVAGLIGEDHFYLQKNKWIWQALADLHHRHEPLDFLTLQTALQANKKLAEIGGNDEAKGRAYLAKLFNSVPSSLNALAYGRIVKSFWHRRKLIETAQLTARLAYDEQMELDEAYTTISAKLRASMKFEGGAVHIREAGAELFDEIQAMANNPRDVIGFSTGFPDIDQITGGIMKQELLILIGKAGKGKSLLSNQLAFTLAYALNQSGTATVIYSLEMPQRQVARRQLAAITGVPTRQMRTGHVPDEEFPNVVEGLSKLQSQYNLYIGDMLHCPNYTTTMLRADMLRLRDEHGVQVAVIDYLEKLKDPAPRGMSKDYERSALLSERVRDIAIELNMAIIAIQRTNKAGLGAGVVGAEHASGSSQIIFDADSIWSINDFQPADESEKFLPPETKANLVTVTFPKIRENESAKHYAHLFRLPGLPAFGNYDNGRHVDLREV